MFPAAFIDVGVPVEAKNLNWRTAAVAGTKFNVWKREYTNAVMVYVPGHIASMTAGDVNNDASNPIDFYESGLCSSPGCVLYPLQADGLTGNSECPASYRTENGGCTAIIPKRAAQGWILMKKPVV
jgi:hypothetical protein